MNIIRKLAVVALLLFTASIAMAAQVKNWTAGGTSTNQNWSLKANWSDLIPPTNGNNMLFFENANNPSAPTNVIGAVNNIANSNWWVQQVGYTAFYVGSTNQSVYTTLIPSGQSVTISNGAASGFPPALTAGDVPDVGSYNSSAGSYSWSTIKGPGNMVIYAPRGFISVGGYANNGSPAVLDMGQVPSLTANVASLRVGALNEYVVDSGGSSFVYGGGFILPRTNNITAFGVNDGTGNYGPGVIIGVDRAANASPASAFYLKPAVLVLGQTNTFNVSGFSVGGPGSYSTLVVFSNYPNSIFKLRGTNGVSPCPVFSVGDFSADVTNYNPQWKPNQNPNTSMIDLFGSGVNSSLTTIGFAGSQDILADVIYIGRSSPGTTPSGGQYVPQGNLLLGSGSVTANNLYLGKKIVGAANTNGASGYLFLCSNTVFTVNNNAYYVDRTNTTATMIVSNNSLMDIRGTLTQGFGSSSTYVNNSTSYFGSLTLTTNTGFTLVCSNNGLVVISNSINNVFTNTPTIAVASGALGGSKIVVNGDMPLGQLFGEGTVTNPGTITIGVQNNGINAGTLSTGQKASLFLGNNLNIANVTNMTFDLSSDNTVGGGVNDYIKVPGAVTFNSATNTIISLNYSNGLASGTYVLMDYASATGLPPTNAPIITRASISVVTNNNQLQLVVGGMANVATLYWQGTNSPNPQGGNWYLGASTNYWLNTNGLTAANFQQFDNVIFDEAYAWTNKVNLVQDVLIGSVTYNLTNTTSGFTNTGSFRMYGQGGLTKNGPGWLSITNPNDFYGPVQINGGVVWIGNASAFGTAASLTGMVAIASGSALSFDKLAGVTSLGSSLSARKYSIAGTGVNNSGVIFYTNLQSSVGTAFTIFNTGVTLSDNALIAVTNSTSATSPNQRDVRLLLQGTGNQDLNNSVDNYGVNTAVLDLNGKTLTINSCASNIWFASGSTTINQTGAVEVAGMKILSSVNGGGINVSSGTLYLGAGSGGGAAFVDSSAPITLGNNTALRLGSFSTKSGSTGYVASAINTLGNATIFQSEYDQTGGGYKIPFTGNISINAGSTLAISNHVPVTFGGVPPAQAQMAVSGQISGNNSTLIKGGAGRLTLSTNETYTGGTFINEGVLYVANNMSFASTNLLFGQNTNTWLDTTGSSGGLLVKQTFAPPFFVNGNLTVGNGAVMGNGALTVGINGSLTVTNGGQIAPGTTFDVGTIVVTNDLILGGDGSNTNFFMNIGASTNKSDQIYVKGNLILSSNTLNIFNVDTLGGFSPDGTNVLIQYSGSLIGGGGLANITNINPTSRFYVQFVDPATTPHFLKVYLVTNPASLTWKGWDVAGGNTNWNIKAATNWSNGGNPDKFYNGDRVSFDDTASTSFLFLTNFVGPDTMTFNNNSLVYTLAGPGYILAGSLTNNGSGGVVISNSVANNYFVGAGLYTGSGKTTTFNQPVDSTVTGDLAGSGNIVKSLTTNTLTINAQDPNTFTGNFTVNSGIMRPAATSITNTFGNVNGLPTVTVGSGAVFDINGSVGDNEKLRAQGAGPILGYVTNTMAWSTNNRFGIPVVYATTTWIRTNQLGAIDNLGSAQTRALTYVVLNGDTTLGAYSNDWFITSLDVNGLSSGTFQGNGRNLTKIGTKDLWIQNGADIGVSNIVVAPDGGKLIFADPSGSLSTQIGLITGTITVSSNSMIGFANCINANSKPMVVLGGGAIYTAGGSNVYLGNITINSGLTFGTATNSPLGTNCFVYTGPNADLLLSGNISGPGNLTLDAIGSISNSFGTSGQITLSGSNSYTGGTLIKEGILAYAASNAFVQNTTNILFGHVTANSSGWPYLYVISNVISPSNVTALLYVDSDGSMAGQNGTYNTYGNWGGCAIGGDGGQWTGPIYILGSPTNNASSLKSQVSFFCGVNGFTFSGPINGSNFRGSTAPTAVYTNGANVISGNGYLSMGGTTANPTNGSGPALTFNGPLNISGTVVANDWFASDLMTKVVLTTNGNNWDFLLWNRGLMQFGADNALPLAPIKFGNGFPGGDHRTIFDLNGHSESFVDVSGAVGDQACWIGNSSPTADATLNYVGYVTNGVISTNVWAYFIVDSLFTNATTKTTSLNVSGGYLALSTMYSGYTDPDNSDIYLSGSPAFSMIPYTGPTTVSGGTLDVNRSLGYSPVTVTGTGTLRGTGTLNGALNVVNGGTVAPGSGVWSPANTIANFASNVIGTLTITNNVTFNSAGNASFNANLDYGINDQLLVVSNLTYGGTLFVKNVGTQPFTNNLALPLFSAASYSGTIPTVLPAAPAFGRVWDTSTLMTDGNLRVSALNTNVPPFITRTISGSGTNATLTMSWPQDHGGYRLQVQTNLLSVGLTNSWVTVPGSTNVLSVTVPINTTNPTVFYRLVWP